MNLGLVPAATSAEVVILGGGLLVGRALELLLQSAHRDVRFLGEPHLKDARPGDPGFLSGVRLLILASGTSAVCREAAVALVDASVAGARIEVLELADHCREALVGARNVLLWPCRTEDLKRRVTFPDRVR